MSFKDLLDLGEKNINYDFNSKCMMINKHCLLKTVILEFLEKRNNMPMLIAKIENDKAKRGELLKYKKMFKTSFCKCFYCESRLEMKFVHVDHFIPWSFIPEDEAWNLVLACNECNCKKSDSLAQKTYLNSLIDRNHEYGSEIKDLGKSLQNLDADAKTEVNSTRTWESEMLSRYKDCKNHGFTLVQMP